MGAFEYTAVDATGRERKGVLEGDTARAVRTSGNKQNAVNTNRGKENTGF